MSRPGTFDAPSTCPWCGRANELQTNADGTDGPIPGAAAVCYGCAAPAVFADDLSLRLPTLEEYDEIVTSETYRALALGIMGGEYPLDLAERVRRDQL